LTGSHDGSLLLWDSQGGQPLRKLYVSDLAETACKDYDDLSRTFIVHPNYRMKGEPLIALAVSHAGSRAAAIGEHGSLRVWRLDDGQELCSTAITDAQRGDSTFVDWIAGDRWLVTNVRSELRLIEPHSGRAGPTVDNRITGRIVRGVTSFDGELLATAYDDRSIRLWTLGSRGEAEELKTFPGHVAAVTSLAISKDHRRLVSGSSDGAIKFWSLETFEEVAHIAKFRGAVHALRFSPDGRYLAAGGEDETGHGEIHLWDGSFERMSGQ